MKNSERMFTWFVVAATVAVFFGFAVRSASAGDPVPGIDISLEEIPGGIVTKGVTGADGVARFPGLAPGTYRVVLDNVATTVGHKTVEELSKPSAESGSQGSGSGPSVNIGIDGIFGSGSTKRSPSERADGRGSTGSAGAGVGVGINIPQSSGEVWNQPVMVEARVKEEGVPSQVRKRPGQVKYEDIRKILVESGVEEAGVKRILDGLDDLVQGQIDYNSSRKNVKLIMKDAGVPDELIHEILSQVEVRIKEEGVPAQRKAQKEQAEADVASRKRIVGGDYGKETFREVGITDAGGGTILWTTLINGRTASFIPRSACDIKDGMEAALVIVDDEPQFAVRISQTPDLPQGVIIQCGGGDPLRGLNIGGGGGSTGGQLCP